MQSSGLILQIRGKCSGPDLEIYKHPNYFGDTAVWWGYGLICTGAGSYLPAAGSLLMTVLIIKVSGVALLEKNLTIKNPSTEITLKKPVHSSPGSQRND